MWSCDKGLSGVQFFNSSFILTISTATLQSRNQVCSQLQQKIQNGFPSLATARMCIYRGLNTLICCHFTFSTAPEGGRGDHFQYVLYLWQCMETNAVGTKFKGCQELGWQYSLSPDGVK